MSHAREGRAPAVTVVIPTHNRLEYLKQALASVAAQHPAVAAVVVVDDGSSDGTAEWLAGLDRTGWGGSPSTQWRHLSQHPAQGGSAARNAGLAACGTPLVLFLDDDDVLRPGAVVALAHALADAMAAGPDVAGAAGAYRRFGQLSEPARDRHPRRARTCTVWREELFGWNMPPASLLWRADVVASLGGWDPTLARCEDRDLNLRAYPRRFVLVPGIVMDYRVHGGQPDGSAQRDVDRLVLDRFVQSLPPRHRRVARGVLAARAEFDTGLPLYVAGDFRAAVGPLVTMLQRAPVLCRSPVLGPWLVGLVAKAAAGAVLPERVAGAVQAAVRRRRSHQNMTR